MGTIVYGVDHCRSSQGILKISECVVCLIGLLLIAIDGWSHDLINAFIVGTAVGLAVSLALLILHITKIAKLMQSLISYHLYFNFVWFIYLLIVSAILLSKHWPNKYMAGGSFGIIAAILYLGDTIDCYRIDPAPLFCLK